MKIMKDFPLESECCICEKYTVCLTRDEDLNGAVCKECHPHIFKANEVIINDLIQCGLLK